MTTLKYNIDYFTQRFKDLKTKNENEAGQF